MAPQVTAPCSSIRCHLLHRFASTLLQFAFVPPLSPVLFHPSAFDGDGLLSTARFPWIAFDGSFSMDPFRRIPFDRSRSTDPFRWIAFDGSDGLLSSVRFLAMFGPHHPSPPSFIAVHSSSPQSIPFAEWIRCKGLAKQYDTVLWDQCWSSSYSSPTICRHPPSSFLILPNARIRSLLSWFTSTNLTSSFCCQLFIVITIVHQSMPSICRNRIWLILTMDPSPPVVTISSGHHPLNSHSMHRILFNIGLTCPFCILLDEWWQTTTQSDRSSGRDHKEAQRWKHEQRQDDEGLWKMLPSGCIS